MFSLRNSVTTVRTAVEFIGSSTPQNIQIMEQLCPRTSIKLPGMRKIEAFGNVHCERISNGNNNTKIIMYLHGGAYIVSNPKCHRNITTRISLYSNMDVFSVSYRLAPDNPFPSALHDSLSAWLHLCKNYNPNDIILAGDSAGGGLALSLFLYLRDNKLPLPSGIVAIGPWLDLTHSQPSFRLNDLDWLPLESMDPKWIIPGKRSQYYTEHDALNTNPLVSPFFANETSRKTPILIQIGDQERLRDESLVFCAERFPSSICEIYQDQVHVFHTFAGLGEPMSLKAFERIGQFCNNPTEKEHGIYNIGIQGETRMEKSQALELVKQGKIELELKAMEKARKLRKSTSQLYYSY